LRLITRLLQLQDFEVTAVADGGAALDALRANYEATAAAAAAGGGAPGLAAPFDLAVLDMSMPVMSGPQAAAAFRAWEAAARPGAMRLPIISLTANAAEEHASECAQAGCVLG
jgi:CheY-like chemotaxis protein